MPQQPRPRPSLPRRARKSLQRLSPPLGMLWAVQGNVDPEATFWSLAASAWSAGWPLASAFIVAQKSSFSISNPSELERAHCRRAPLPVDADVLRVEQQLFRREILGKARPASWADGVAERKDEAQSQHLVTSVWIRPMQCGHLARAAIFLAEFGLPRRVVDEDVWDLVEAHDARVKTGGGAWLPALWLACQVAWVLFACIKNPPKVGEKRERSK